MPDPLNDTTAPSTRLRILATARQLFGEYGYQNTSLRQIAEQLQLTKTAVLYHFPTKAHLIEALAEPLVNDLSRALDEAVSYDFETVRWQVCTGFLDVYLAHRQSLQLLLRDLALFARAPMFDRFVAVTTEANRRVAGPRPDLAARVRAAQAIAMLSDPVILLADAPTPTLRREVLSGLARLLGPPPLDFTDDRTIDAPDERSAARPDSRSPARADHPDSRSPARAAPRGDRGGGAGQRRDRAAVEYGRPSQKRAVGRPTAMSPELVAAAHRLRRGGKHTMAQIAAQLGVSRATLYRYF